MVRELLDGPRRYVDLLDGLVSIPTDTLANRLRALEQNELVTRRRLGPPADRRRVRAHRVGPGARAGHRRLRRVGPAAGRAPEPGDAVRPQWLAQLVRSRLRPDRAGVDLTLALRTPETAVTLRITGAGVDTLDDEAAADVTLEATVEDLAVALDPDEAARLVDQGRLTVEGRRHHVRQLAPSLPPAARALARA